MRVRDRAAAGGVGGAQVSQRRLSTWRGARDCFLGWFTVVMTIAASPKLETGLEAGLALAVSLAVLQVLDRWLMEGMEKAALEDRPYEADPAWY